MNLYESLLKSQLHSMCPGLLKATSVEDHSRAQSAATTNFHLRRRRRHDNPDRNAQCPAMPGKAERMIPSGSGYHPAPRRMVWKQAQSIARPTLLKAACRLNVFSFAENLAARQLRKPCRIRARGSENRTVNAHARGHDVLK